MELSKYNDGRIGINSLQIGSDCWPDNLNTVLSDHEVLNSIESSRVNTITDRTPVKIRKERVLNAIASISKLQEDNDSYYCNRKENQNDYSIIHNTSYDQPIRANLFKEMHEKFNREKHLVNSTIDRSFSVKRFNVNESPKTYEKQMRWLKYKEEK